MNASNSNFFSLYGRLLKKVAIYKGDILAVSDKAFYLITKKKVYKRDKLVHLVKDKRTRKTDFVKAFIEQIKKVDISLIATLMNALYSDSLTEKLFVEANGVMSIEEFAKYVIEYGKQLTWPYIMTECRVPEKEIPISIYTPFLPVNNILDILGIKHALGISETSLCIVIDKEKEIGIALVE